MSLINEALKKAQRRTEETSSDSPPAEGGARITRRGQARSSQTMVLLGAGALVLVVLSVVVTVWLVSEPATPSRPVVVSVPPPLPVANVDAPAAAITVSLPKPAAEPKAAAVPEAVAAPAQTNAASDAPAAPAAAAPILADAPLGQSSSHTLSTTSPSGGDAAAAHATVAPAPATAEPRAAAAPGAGSARADERVSAFVDAIRVAGIRSSGNESRVLMNERVYRVNDIVERTLGVRLIKVEADSLTFADANGVTYVKNF